MKGLNSGFKTTIYWMPSNGRRVAYTPLGSGV